MARGTTYNARVVTTPDVVIRPLTPLGAEVTGLDLSGTLSGAVRDLLRTAWEKHALLLFRGQDLTNEHLFRAAEIFGRIADEGWASGGMNYVSNVAGGIKQKGEMTTSAVGDGDLAFHFDHSFMENPLKGVLLNGVEIPAKGGDTLYADLRGACELLPPAIRNRVSTLTIRHQSIHQPGCPTADHPLFWRHPDTGVLHLFFSGFHAAGFLDVSPDESAELFTALSSFIQQRDVYRHCWKPQDLIIWDNLALQHARTTFDQNLRRHLCRIQIGF